MSRHDVLPRRRSWEDFPFDMSHGAAPKARDVPPQRTEAGDFIFYHGTSRAIARKIVRERTLKHDDFKNVGVGTLPSAVTSYAVMKGGPLGAILQLVVKREWLAAQQIRREIGGSGVNQWLIQALEIPSDALVDIHITSQREREAIRRGLPEPNSSMQLE